VPARDWQGVFEGGGKHPGGYVRILVVSCYWGDANWQVLVAPTDVGNEWRQQETRDWPSPRSSRSRSFFWLQEIFCIHSV